MAASDNECAIAIVFGNTLQKLRLMMSKQARNSLSIAAIVLLASGLTVWLLSALGTGFRATLAPLVVAALVLVVSRLVKRRKMDDFEG